MNDPMWTVRGEPRDRDSFGKHHPDDFPGDTPELLAARIARWETWAQEQQAKRLATS